MGTKSFFNKQKSQEVKIRGQKKSTIDNVKQNVESIEYIKEYSIDKLDFVPQLDFENPANFVKYGSAEDYYVDLVDSVIQAYPYDGSLAERLKYRNGLVAIQKHEFDKNYPRSVGYADFSDESFLASLGTPFTIGDITFTLGESFTDHYIITDNYSNNLVYNTGSQQVGSLEIDFSVGATVELWMKKDAFPDPSETQNEVVFSISSTEGTINDLFQITTDVTGSGKEKLYATFSKTAAFTPEFVYEFDTGISGSTGNGLADGNWHHYAFSFSTSSTGYIGEFYVDGHFREKKFYTKSSPDYYLTGTLDATVGASSLSAYLGDGGLIGSVDEVRLWKTTRNAKEIGINYFYDVGGGGNTDTTKVNNNSPLGLSLYYKFNEGNTGATTTDSIVLDSSGRLTNGVWVGYSAGSRATGSAIIESGTTTEVGDPIIYSTHPDVVSYKADKIISGSAYDTDNLGSTYNMMPQWIRDEDAANGLLTRKMTQVMSSYLDTLYGQITAIAELQDGSYVSGSNAKPNPFSKRNLTSYGFDIPDVFIDPKIIEEIYFKDEKRLYEDKLFNLKNLIFQNIFNNLNYINKSKGTEKSFRNLFRCFGVDDELVRLNMYSDNQQYEIRENYETSQIKRNIVDLSGYNDGQNREVVLYQFADVTKNISETGDSGYIPSSSNTYIPLTFESQFQFPKFVDLPNGYLSKLTRSSLFGVHSASSDTAQTTIPSNDLYFKVYADTNNLNKTQFILETNIASVGSLTSSFYENVYDNTEWTFAVRTKPREYPYAQEITASDVFDLEFYGVNYIAGYKLHEFSASAEVNLSNDIGQFITGSNKRLYVGADRENVTGSLNHKSNTRVISSRVWFDYLTNVELSNHARDVSGFGRLNPYKNSFIFEGQESENYIPRIETLALHWNFENITGSNSSGKFLVQDITSGSNVDIDNRYAAGDYSRYVGTNYSGQGTGATADSTKVVDFLFVDAAKQQLPENLYSSDLVEIREGDDSLFTRESRPSKYYFAVETSLYDTISREMLGFFASINDFNSLIGNPVNMYRPNYKALEKLRGLFFENIQNNPDLDKFVNLYKWVDGALDSVIANLIPASARTSDKVRNIVESHILERSKYIHKYIALKGYKKEDFIKQDPNIEITDTIPIGKPVIEFPIGIDIGGPIQNDINVARKVPEEIRKGKVRDRGSLRPKPSASEIPLKTREIIAPANPLVTKQGDAPFWFRTRANRGTGEILSTGDDSVDWNRIQVKANQSQIATGSRQSPFVFRVDATRAIGTNVGFAGENRKNYFPNSFSLSSGTVGQDGLSLEVRKTITNIDGEPYYDYEDARDETYDNNRLTPLDIYDLVSSDKLPGQNYLPFDVLSASNIIAPYQQYLFDRGFEVKVESKHRDYNGAEGSNLQGPFTNEHVGGYMYRHGNLLEVDPLVRKEGYQFNVVENQTIHINNPRMVSGSTPVPEFTKDRPLGHWLRDTAAKRPVNIKNISGSNYFYDYEIVQTSGRLENNRYYVKSNGYTGTANNTSNMSYDDAGVFFYKDFRILNRDTTGSNDFIIVNRFSAPGGPEVNSLAFLDIEAAEYSVYNNLNYRNFIVRLENNKLLTRHTLSGGYDSVLLQPTGAFYKTPRNGIYKISASLETPETIFDNSYVGHGIPRTDVQYRWVASSWIARKTGYPNSATLNSSEGLLTASGRNPAFGQNQSDFDYNISSSDYSPIYGRLYSDNIRYASEGHIEYGVGGSVPVSVAFNATNYIIVGDIDLDRNLFTTASTSVSPGDYYSLPDFDAGTAPFLLNGLLLSNNGPYQHPTFKQIRSGEHRVGREFWQQNIYRNQIDILSDDRQRRLRFGEQYSINQAPVTAKFKPIRQFVDEGTGSIQYELGNNLHYYANTYDVSSNEIKDYNLEMGAPAVDINKTDFYRFSQKFNIINYKEIVYPKDENIYKEETRERLNYLSFWISDTLDIRTADSITNSQGDLINASQWPMDVSTSGSNQAETSGELMRNTGSTGAGLAESEANARYSFNIGECRPKNTVQSQANTGAFYPTYGEFSVDTRLIGQDETIIPEFIISDFINTVIVENNGDFLNESLYEFSLTGSDSLTGNSFAERYGKTEKTTYLEQLKDFYGEPTAIRLSFNTTKKLLPKTGFYPQQRIIQLAQQFSSSYKNSTVTIGATNFSNPTGAGSEETWSTALLPFWAPGIGLNSIKAGFAVEFPYKSTGSAAATGGIDHGFNTTAPFESILSPSEHVELVMHIANSGSTELRSTASVNKTDGVYERMSHNFFAEVPDFFLDDLASFRSAPAATWQFEGPLSSSEGVKKFAMDVLIENPVDFLMYGGGDAFGPFPYNNHAPPGYYWNSSGGTPGEYCEFLTNTGGTRSGYTKARIVFDPTNLLSTDGRLGKTSFTLQDIVANSTVEHTNFLVERDGVSPSDTVFMSLSASLDMFVQADDGSWVIRSKWECPVLNFVDVAAETDGSETAIKGMWHQYGELAGSNARKRLNLRVDDTEYLTGSLTGSLAEAVGFEKKAVAFGKIKPRKIVEEAICAIPYYVDCETGEEKFFETPLSIFENRYSLVRRDSSTTDSFSDMIRKMDKYVLPPPYDFVHTRDKRNKTLNDREDFLPARPPFSMYFFEFNSTLRQQDLANIWQGVMPSIATQAEKQKVVLEHPIVDGELLSPTIFKYNELTGIPNDIRWKIFKVKKRASYDYYKMLQDKTNSPTYKRLDVDRFSFNYPYDQFSLVELGKMDVEFEVRNDNPDRIRQIAGGGYIKPEDVLVGAVNLSQPIQITSEQQPARIAERIVKRCTQESLSEFERLRFLVDSDSATAEQRARYITLSELCGISIITPVRTTIERTVEREPVEERTIERTIERSSETQATTQTIQANTGLTTGITTIDTVDIDNGNRTICTELEIGELDELQVIVKDVGIEALSPDERSRYNELVQKC